MILGIEGNCEGDLLDGHVLLCGGCTERQRE